MAVHKKWFLVMISTTVLSACFLVLMCLFVLSKSIHVATTHAQKNIKLEMFFQEDMNAENVQWIETLKNKFEIQDIHLVSKAEAQSLFISLMKNDWGSLAEDQSLLTQLPSSVVIQFQDDISGEKIQNLANQIVNEAQQFENYDSYIFQKDWAQWFSSYKNFSEQIVIYLGVFTGLLIFLIVSNLNRAIIFQHIKEIEVLHLLGATRWQITRPYLVQSFALSLFSVLISYFLTYFVTEMIKRKSFESGQLIPIEKLSSMSPVEMSLFLVFVLAISLYSAQVCVKDQLK